MSGYVRGGRGRDALVVITVFLALGLVCGVLWWRLVDPAAFTKTHGGGGSMSESELAKRFNADGWYAVIAIVGGFVAGLLLTWWRWRDPLVTVVSVLVGSALAAALMAVVGHLLGPVAPSAALSAATTGQLVPVQLSVLAKGCYLLWPIASLAAALVALWSTRRTTPDP
jgi:hypothetical protein